MFRILLIQCLILLSAELLHSQDMNKTTQTTMQTSKSPETNLTSMMHRYTAYNYWVSQQMTDWLNAASDVQLDREIESSFNSLKKTVLHSWSAEYLWLRIIQGKSTENNPTKDFEGSRQELLDGWLQASKNFSDYVETLSLEDLQVKVPRSKGGFFVLADMIQHCMNHTTYHRGNLITMGRQAGLENPPRTDFIHYISLPEE